MEDWQQWQIRADQIASVLTRDIDVLAEMYVSEAATASLRSFWPRFRELKERVRVAPAIKLEDKLALERKLRDIGAKAYKLQEAAYSQSSRRKEELLTSISAYRASGEQAQAPRELRIIRRDLDAVRSSFDAGSELVSPDRQAVWESWREASQFVWDRLTSIWTENEEQLRSLVDHAKAFAEAGDGNAARQGIAAFFDALKYREARQNVVSELKNQASEIRNLASKVEERKVVERVASQPVHSVSPLEAWKSDFSRNSELITRLSAEVADLEEAVQGTRSILDQAVMRGGLVEKKQKLADLERTNRALEQRIEQAEESPLLSMT